MQKLVPLRALYSRYMYSRDFSAGTGIEEESPEAVTCGRNTDPSSNNLVVIGPEMDGAPQVERFFVVWNPPLRDNKEGEEEEQEEEEREVEDICWALKLLILPTECWFRPSLELCRLYRLFLPLLLHVLPQDQQIPPRLW
mmetsp:Transcript_25806/g.43313  ORF Transcript_25806/g.43313 Transcript_25806/m.43313 type:complete len:140 (-) Transcript_25806:118-537(-)